MEKIDLRENEPELFRRTWRGWRHAAADSMLIGISADGTTVGLLSLKNSVPNGRRLRLLGLGAGAVVAHAHVDIFQDLLVTVNESNEILVRSLRTGMRHPRCTSTPSMKMPLPPGEMPPLMQSITVSGQWLLACNEISGPPNESTDRCRIYHWPSGREHKVKPIFWISIRTD